MRIKLKSGVRSLEILKDWIHLIDEDGWVAREQILGEEARSKVNHFVLTFMIQILIPSIQVPSEFQTQVPSFANPPTLTMAVTAFIARARTASLGPTDQDLGMDTGSQIPLSGFGNGGVRSKYLESPELTMSFLKSIYQPLKRHYDWFRRTQRGQIKLYGRQARSRTEAYRWRGRSEKHVLTSGMDDYPRGPPHAGELHLDLISWMAFFTRTMKDVASFVGEVDDAISFGEIEHGIIGNIDGGCHYCLLGGRAKVHNADLHWNEENKMYCDANVNDDGIPLSTGHPQRLTSNLDESYHVCHKGYVSLFPFLLSLLPPSSPHLGPILDMLRDPEHLWSPYGLRSLSASHEEFGQGENYWKGPIWVQMNYLALSALYKASS
jgi:mannosyl-oligosaccharide glucosidase